MKELIIQLIQVIASWLFIIYLIYIIIKKVKQKNIKIQTEDIQYKPKEENQMPYVLNNNIFTQNERFFYNVLKDITNKLELIIMTKVRLADIITTYSNEYKYFNKIKAKHIDFVLIDNKGTIKLLIELDDKSHEQPERQKRDQFLNDIFKQLNIKLLRIPAKYSYNILELEKQIQENL